MLEPLESISKRLANIKTPLPENISAEDLEAILLDALNGVTHDMTRNKAVLILCSTFISIPLLERIAYYNFACFMKIFYLILSWYNDEPFVRNTPQLSKHPLDCEKINALQQLAITTCPIDPVNITATRDAIVDRFRHYGLDGFSAYGTGIVTEMLSSPSLYNNLSVTIQSHGLLIVCILEHSRATALFNELWGVYPPDKHDILI